EGRRRRAARLRPVSLWAGWGRYHHGQGRSTHEGPAWRHGQARAGHPLAARLRRGDRGSPSLAGAGSLSRVEQLRAREDFDAARFKAFRRAIGAILTGKARRLMSLNRVLEAARLEGQAYTGVREIP